MRTEFARAILQLLMTHTNNVMLTGDLGFMAFESLQKQLGKRFINAGVAEQNMISVAAGLAYEGFYPWVYSIAPFAVFRPYEQIRNDICLHKLPVKIVGNGGGYGYGIMGVTHHALEDIAVMRVLPNMRVFVPMITSDVDAAMRGMAAYDGPAYLRLNMPAKLSCDIPSFAPWRQIQQGDKCVVIGTGPVLGNILSLEDRDIVKQLNIWAVGILPLSPFPHELTQAIELTKKVVVIEEHSGQCGLNETVAARILEQLQGSIRFKSIHATGYPSGRYGSQRWHQKESGLAGALLEQTLRTVINA